MILSDTSDLLLLDSPLGTALLAEYDGAALRALHFWPAGAHPPARTRHAPHRTDEIGRAVAAQLREYFAGRRRRFDLPIEPVGTDFQRRVWAALLRIPWGETRGYAELASAIGSPGASRAVGQANRRNRLPVVVPCHRVVPASGGVGGYAGRREGAGAEAKRWLLELERS